MTDAALHATVLAGYRLSRDGIHGPSHWARVRLNGRALAARTPGADGEVVALFALLHDARREHDGDDPAHGERAAALAEALAAQRKLRLDAARLGLLVAACAGHAYGRVSEEPTIGCCWDADRLDLSRLGRRPEARLLSTRAAREPAIQATAWRRGRMRVRG
jgi:uncharacterized protein